VRVLIDACLPVELKALLEGTEVKTARDMGWQGLDNGQLLKRADGRERSAGPQGHEITDYGLQDNGTAGA
jgi:hypothetical protein